jgi:peptidoglycan/xylan/chitin deacetylase (PgdA/CDA1 family)
MRVRPFSISTEVLVEGTSPTPETASRARATKSVDRHSRKPTASISLDLDNKWSYLKMHGDASWESLPSYLDLVVPRLLDMLAEFDFKITVFVVGQDAALPKNRNAIQAIANAGHEIGNHSFHHEPWLHLYSKEKLIREFELTEAAIEEVTGQRPRGFRGPGFSFSPEVLRVLVDRDYLYDGSTFPTFLGPIARAYYFFRSRLSSKEKSKRGKLFGSWRDGFRPLKPYRWKYHGHELLEIPVSTIPIVRIPFHLSYVLYLSQFSPALAKSYFWWAIKMCRLTRTEPSILLHPLDFLGCDDDQDLSFFPAMNIPSKTKLDVVRSAFQTLKSNFDAVNMSAHAIRLSERDLPRRNIV